jgi:sulfoxide reductase heme-binding subunit YedZ
MTPMRAPTPTTLPIGGIRRDARHRLVRFHLPMALASIVVLVAFMALPIFDANAYPHADLFSGSVPQARSDGPQTQHGPSRTDERSDSAGHGAMASPDPDAQSATPGDQTAPHAGGGPMQGMGGGHVPGTGPRPTFLGLNNRRFTVATGYLATGFLALTLLLGPANLLLGRRNPISSYLRRDAGVWTVIFSMVHVFYGLQVHQRLADFLDYFIGRDGPLTNAFGLGNWTGLAALVIAIGLLAISSDAALRKLKAQRWKRLQRLNYVLFALVIAHAFFYGAIVRADSPYTTVLLLSVITVVVLQVIGIDLWRRRHMRAPPAPG